MNREEKIERLNKSTSYSFEDLVDVVSLLRAPGGCPWDIEQTHESIRSDFIEETYEVIEAIDNKDRELLCEELGDVMLQVVFHAGIETDAGTFNINDVIDGICKKLIHRHPHVFGDISVNDSAEVLKNWDIIKSEEKQRETVTSKLKSIPRQLPALMRAQKVGKKAKCFDFADADAVFDKLNEEKNELLEAAESNDQEKIKEEAGDLLLTVTSLCRKLKVDAEEALNSATDKFINRFELIENEVILSGKDINSVGVEELDEIWEKNKEKQEKNS